MGWNRRPPLYGPNAELYWTRKPRLAWTSPLSFSHVTLNWMIRSGMAATWSAFLYSGCFSNRLLFSRVEESSRMAC